MDEIYGRIHSIETCGAVDGPGLRFVIFTQGCPLRCQYCHNPDTRAFQAGKLISVDEIMKEIEKYRSFLKFSGGGVTISGGEPCAQPKFIMEIFRRCKEAGFHTALDTSGYISVSITAPLLEYVDLVLLDIKSFDPGVYKEVTGVEIEPTLDFARYLQKIKKPTWVRFVLVPGLTDGEENVRGLARFVATLDNVEKVEVLPFHKMGEYKWKELRLDYKLQETQPPSQELVDHVNAIFAEEKAKRL